MQKKKLKEKVLKSKDAANNNGAYNSPTTSISDISKMYGEMGLARNFIHNNGLTLRYDHTISTWFVWDYDKSIWIEDDKMLVINQLFDCMNEQISQEISDLMSKIYDTKDPKDLHEKLEALNLQKNAMSSAKKINSVLSLARAQPSVAITSDKWDNNPYELGVRNVCINLKTGESNIRLPFQNTKTYADITWNGLDEPCPMFESFLNDIFDGDTELIYFMQELLGHTLVGEVVEHVFPIFVGSGRNGKGELIYIISKILGNYSISINKDDLMQKKNSSSASPTLASLQGKRFAVASETEEGQRLKSAMIKLMTGGDEISARWLYGQPFNFWPSHSVFLMTNKPPHIDADDDAIWERVYRIDFNMLFTDNPTEPHHRKKIRNIGKSIVENESSGVLAWLIRGCIRWLERGMLVPPEIVKINTDEYRADEDTLGAFIDEVLIVGEGRKIYGKEIYQLYATWSKEGNMKPMTKTAFGKKFGTRFDKSRDSKGNFYIGVGYELAISDRAKQFVNANKGKKKQ